ncbi:MAG: hypothetical protein EXS18_02395 [Verrucomicrobiae bacterium]|nr:hypothetical protein [Verrucomicrobiae bacterium]
MLLLSHAGAPEAVRVSFCENYISYGCAFETDMTGKAVTRLATERQTIPLTLRRLQIVTI